MKLLFILVVMGRGVADNTYIALKIGIWSSDVILVGYRAEYGGVEAGLTIMPDSFVYLHRFSG